MNKEAKELIDTLKEYGDGFTSVLAPTEESVKALLDYINQLEKGSYIEEGINGQWTNWKFEAENYKKVCDDLYKKVNQLETNIDEAIEYVNKYFEKEYKKPREELKKYNLKNCTYDSGLVVLGILERGKEC